MYIFAKGKSFGVKYEGIVIHSGHNIKCMSYMTMTLIRFAKSWPGLKELFTRPKQDQDRNLWQTTHA